LPGFGHVLYHGGVSEPTERPGRGGNAADADAVRAVLGGDVERYAELVHRYRDRYARYAVHLLGSIDAAEDAVQDAFIRAFDQLGQCRDPGNFVNWFFLILRNRCLADRRRDKKRSGLEDSGAHLIPAPGSASDRVEQREEVSAIQRALMALTDEQREVFVLRHVEGWSYEEIAERTKASVAALKMRMHRAYEGLRERLAKGDS
jgi:RNA polymerase sigma-70 factor (ECF subfamily)